MKALVVFGTTEGHTRKIAQKIEEWLVNRDMQVVIADSASDARNLSTEGFDVVVLAGSLHMSRHQASLVHFVRTNLAALQRIPTLLVSASGTGSRTDPLSGARANESIELFVQESGLRPTVAKPIGGALLYTKYNFFLRWMLRKISEKEGGPVDTSRDYELTDWESLNHTVDAFIDHFAMARSPEPAFSTR